MSRPADRVPAGFDEADRDLAEVLDDLEGATEYVSWIVSLVEPHLGSRVLEVGAGTGTITERLVGQREVVALEPSEMLAETLRARVGARASVVVGTLESLPAEGQFDAVVMVNVLEHIPDDADALQRTRDLLTPGGRLVLWVPAFDALYGRFDHLIGHYRRYRRFDLGARCADAGLSVIESRYANLPGFAAWWLIVRVLRRTPTGGGLARVYDRYAVPVIRRIEARWRVPFGQSILLVAERPSGS